MRKAFVAFAVVAFGVLFTGLAASAPPLWMTVGTLGTIGSLDPRAGDSTVAREVWNI